MLKIMFFLLIKIAFKMKIIRLLSEMQAYSSKWDKNKKVSLIPTMGCLHNGHLSLIKSAKNNSDIVVVSIFINPMQFTDSDDFNKYPKSYHDDIKYCENMEVDFIFIPESEDIIIDIDVWVYENKLSKLLCGKSRPGHFQGVCTIVLKLFNIVQPQIAIFGEKDLQQLRIIQKMVLDLNIPINIISCPIHREPDGLALSSRNKRLSNSERNISPIIYNSLSRAKNEFLNGEKSTKVLINLINNFINKNPEIHIDYIKIVDLKNMNELEKIISPAVIMIAVFIGKIRLIDNIFLIPK